jgi:ppGpp synthetase/RelA/SpoT-type nucleotidyltranferase
MSDLATLRREYIRRRPDYNMLATAIEDSIKAHLRERGIRCTITKRVKDVSSFLKKTIYKEYGDPFVEMSDLAGVRVVAPFGHLVATIDQSLSEFDTVVDSRFGSPIREDKGALLAPDRLGYTGIHYDLTIKPECAVDGLSGLVGMQCEVQLQTQAQRLWADLSHPLLYKSASELPDSIKRRAYGLVALLDIVDERLDSTHLTALSDPKARNAAVLSALDRVYYEFTGKDYTPDLSWVAIEGLKALYSESELMNFEDVCDALVERRGEKLRKIYARYENDDRANPMLFQPEVLMVFDRLDCDAFRVADVWQDIFPSELLVDLASIWGTPIS